MQTKVCESSMLFNYIQPGKINDLGKKNAFKITCKTQKYKKNALIRI